MPKNGSKAASSPELTARSIIVGLVVAVIIGAAYPYVVLKLGFGPNLSVVSAFFGFIALVLMLRATGTNARENNIVQTMGTSAGQTAFMAVLLAAFDMLNAKGVLNPPIRLNTLQIFCWLCSASLLGILLAVPMRRHYIDEENLTYADGLAAGETIKVLHERPSFMKDLLSCTRPDLSSYRIRVLRPSGQRSNVKRSVWTSCARAVLRFSRQS